MIEAGLKSFSELSITVGCFYLVQKLLKGPEVSFFKEGSFEACKKAFLSLFENRGQK